MNVENFDAQGNYPPPATVRLKNGSEEHAGLVRMTMVSLASLMEREPIAFYELVELARNPAHALFGNTGEKLADLALLSLPDRNNGRPGALLAPPSMHSSIRAVILSAVEGEGLDMVLGNPEAP
jgi:hypothetical protein